MKWCLQSHSSQRATSKIDYVYNIEDLMEIFFNSIPKFMFIFLRLQPVACGKRSYIHTEKFECKSNNPLETSITPEQMKMLSGKR